MNEHVSKAPATNHRYYKNDIDKAAYHMGTLNMREAPSVFLHHVKTEPPATPFDGHFQAKKRLNFRITNIRTGRLEEHDPAKHYLHPEEHHPDNEEMALDKLEEEAKMGKMTDEEFEARHHSIKHTFRAAHFATRAGGSVVHGAHVYAPPSLKPELAIWKANQGYSKQLVPLNDRGDVHFDMSARDRQSHANGFVDYNWNTGAVSGSNRHMNAARRDALRRLHTSRPGSAGHLKALDDHQRIAGSYDQGAMRRQRAAQKPSTVARQREEHVRAKLSGLKNDMDVKPSES